jgi:hypothetical protein
MDSPKIEPALVPTGICCRIHGEDFYAPQKPLQYECFVKQRFVVFA